MTCHRICDQQRQPCPSAWLCEMGCNFTNAELPATKLETRNSDSSNPGYDYTFMPDWLDLGIAWMQRWAKWVAAVCAYIALLIYMGAKL